MSLYSYTLLRFMQSLISAMVCMLLDRGSVVSCSPDRSNANFRSMK